MALKDLIFNILARDKTGQAFRSVQDKLKRTEGAAATLQERMRRVGTGMRNIGAAGSAASLGLASVFRGSIQMYDLQARAERKVAQAIEATGGAAGLTAERLGEVAGEWQRVSRFGDEDILNNVTAQLLTFKEISGDTFLAAQGAALNLATVLDGDLKSASIMLGKALNDPAVGLTALSRAGVTFTEDQKAMVKAMVETGDVLGAQTLILDEIESAYGGQARAAREAGAGVLDAWQNTWGDVKEIFGAGFLELLRPVLGVLERLADAFQNASPTVQRFASVAVALGVVLPPLVATLGVLVIGISAVGAPVAAAIAGFAAFAAAAVALWPKLVELKDTVVSAFGSIRDTVLGVVDAIVSAIQDRFVAVMDTIGDKVEWVEGKFRWLYDKVVGNSWVPDLVDGIVHHFGRLAGGMVAPTEEGTEAVDGQFGGLVGKALGALRGLARDGELTWTGFWDKMLTVSQRMGDRIIDDAFSKLADGVAGALSNAWSGAGGAGAGGGGGGLGALLGGVGRAFAGLLGFNDGGAFTVRGRAGIDRNVAAVRLSEGETVQVTRRGEAGRAVNVTVNISTPDVDGFRRSRAQVGAQIGRAVAAGQRAA